MDRSESPDLKATMDALNSHTGYSASVVRNRELVAEKARLGSCRNVSDGSPRTKAPVTLELIRVQLMLCTERYVGPIPSPTRSLPD